jgi:phosphoglycolate phosphatase-like HAD superfamily hydrolase
MSVNSPQIIALDFDGVICNGLREYFESSQRTYQQIWPQTTNASLAPLAEKFYQLRPVVELGWEMPILLRALVLEIEPTSILENWPAIGEEILSSENLDRQTVIAQLDEVRDCWIREDLTGWLNLHQFYPGVITRLQQILATSTLLYIVTTKEGRFVRQLLQKQGLAIPESAIIGKEIKRPKSETLREILTVNTTLPTALWFVEDLLKTLRSVQQQPDLEGVQLFLADWGYNTRKMRESIANDHKIQLLSLEKFTQDFKGWTA